MAGQEQDLGLCGAASGNGMNAEVHVGWKAHKREVWGGGVGAGAALAWEGGERARGKSKEQHSSGGRFSRHSTGAESAGRHSL